MYFNFLDLLYFWFPNKFIAKFWFAINFLHLPLPIQSISDFGLFTFQSDAQCGINIMKYKCTVRGTLYWNSSNSGFSYDCLACKIIKVLVVYVCLGLTTWAIFQVLIYSTVCCCPALFKLFKTWIKNVCMHELRLVVVFGCLITKHTLWSDDVTASTVYVWSRLRLLAIDTQHGGGVIGLILRFVEATGKMKHTDCLPSSHAFKYVIVP
jgi:hypothetical protein